MNEKYKKKKRKIERENRICVNCKRPILQDEQCAWDSDWKGYIHFPACLQK